MTQPRTGQQNRGLHKGFELVAQSLNDAGLDMKTVLKPDIAIPWTKESVKNYLYRPIMHAMYGKGSTTELAKQEEPGAVWETMMRFLMEKHHIEYVPFPSNEIGYWDTAPVKDKSA